MPWLFANRAAHNKSHGSDNISFGATVVVAEEVKILRVVERVVSTAVVVNECKGHSTLRTL